MKTRIESLSFLATLAIVVGMISWGGTLNAQTAPSAPAGQPQTQQPMPDTPPTQQAPKTETAPSPENPPASQQTPTSQTPGQTPSTTQTPNSTQTPSSPTPGQTPSATDPSPSTAPSTAPSTSATPGQPTGAKAGAAGASGRQEFSGTVVKSGDKYVLKDDAGKTYQIDHQDDVKKFEGKRVRVQGTLDPSGTSISVQ